MKLVSLDRNIEVSLSNTRQPKMTNTKGRTWSIEKIIYVCGKHTPLYLDTSWGNCGYFEHDKKWYSMCITCVDKIITGERFDIKRGKVK